MHDFVIFIIAALTLMFMVLCVGITCYSSGWHSGYVDAKKGLERRKNKRRNSGR